MEKYARWEKHKTEQQSKKGRGKVKQNKEEKCKKQERQGGGKSMSKGEDKQREGGQEKESAWRYTHIMMI